MKQGWTRRKKIGGCLVIALLVTIVSGIGVSMNKLAFATSKGLKVDLEVASDYGPQNAEVDTFQDGRFISTHDQFIDQGSWVYGLQYEKGDINNGQFEVCVFLTSDQIEGCGNGYNSEEKKPENVFVDLTSACNSKRNTQRRIMQRAHALAQAQAKAITKTPMQIHRVKR